MSSSNPPRQHHLLSKAYLKGFTDSGTVNGTLWVFDYFSGRRYKAKPRKASRKRDFFRVEVPDLDSQFFERLMGEFEGVVAGGLLSIQGAGRAATQKEVGDVLSLAALFAARDQRSRDQVSTVLAASLSEHLSSGSIPKEQWERIRESELQLGVDPSQVPPYEVAIEGLKSGTWKPNAPRVALVDITLDAQEHIMEVLTSKKWELMSTDPQQSGGFITSDSPLVWGNLDNIVRGDASESLSDHDVEVTFPVTKSTALVSYPDARSGNVTATQDAVAHVNSRTLQMSYGKLFHSEDDFALRISNGDLIRGSYYMSQVKEARYKGIVRP